MFCFDSTQIAEITAQHRREEKDLREKLLAEQKKMSDKSEVYQQKILMLQKQNATLSKQTKKSKTDVVIKSDSPSQDSPL